MIEALDSSPQLEVRIPISPSASMFNRVLLIALSIRTLGPRFENTRFRISIGSPTDPGDLRKRFPWSEALDIRWSWVGAERWARWAHTANPNIGAMVEDRFFTPRSPGMPPFILFLDVDVLAIKPFLELLDPERPPVQAMMAHASPFKDHRAGWEKLFGGVAADHWFKHEHSGWKIMETAESRRLSPPYFNTGVVVMQKDAFRPYVVHMHEEALGTAAALYNSYFVDQLAFTLMLMNATLPYKTLPLRYNFPNQPAFDRLHPEELREARFIHFLRTDTIDRNRDFESRESILRLISRKDLTGSNETLRQRIEELYPSFATMLT